MRPIPSIRPALAGIVAALALIATVPADSGATSPHVLATPWTELHTSRVRLVAGPSKTSAGHYMAGLEMDLADGWKTYWRMPGDSGVPPSFDWAGSANLAAAKVLYPAPARMPEAGGVAIGYKGAVLLPIEVTPTEPNKPVTLKLSLEFGLCRDICIPVSASFDLVIPPQPAGALPTNIAEALERVPRTAQSQRKTDPDLKRVHVTTEGVPALVIEAAFPGGGTSADAFVEAPEGFYVPIPKRVSANGNVVTFTSELGRDLAQDLKGKPLTITLVSGAGSTEARWTMP
jgi:DsbC/DsbD-like thiol-disulfide interchange protein